MRDLSLRGRGRAIRDTSSPLRPPQQSSRHSFANPLAVCLFVNDSQIFGVNAQEQLRHTLARKARLDINNNAVIRHLTMRLVLQFAISPQPKRRSSMRHFIFIPLPGEPAASGGRRFRYATLFDASIDSYKRYRSNDLAEESVNSVLLADRIQLGAGHA